MTDLGDDPQSLLTSQKKRQDITYILIEVHNANSKTLFIKLKQLREQEQGIENLKPTLRQVSTSPPKSQPEWLPNRLSHPGAPVLKLF